MAERKRVKAIVRVVLDVEAGGVWGGECNWDQIARQAEDSVRGLLTNSNKLSAAEIPRRIRALEMTEVRVVPESQFKEAESAEEALK
jgi:hypothetical protein